MVIALFLQILVMIIDRYLYKSKTFISVQQKESKELQKERSLSKMEDSKTEQSIERSNSELDRNIKGSVINQRQVTNLGNSQDSAARSIGTK